ncbi:DUF455-domain-containing protein [Dendrothele bispora CBS 962.96]|uniref:DUF455-domain-containing protein n=1 Tax=Dendrothele bispora (strain CBS 962.96) TaxID=1314807 RepID=A0A4S8L9S1_DENBC|nr:DUF455-domain-containing protein [Dendrothele bispora CBS 962.96]
MSSSRVLICPTQRLLSHFRFLLTLRSEEGKYHGLIIFRLSTGRTRGSSSNLTDKEVDVDANPDTNTNTDTGQGRPEWYDQLYIMESTCPHLGAEMTHADIEEYEDSVVAVCPWHRYDFDLKTGRSETGLRTCTYPVHIDNDPVDGVDKVYMDAPEHGKNWRVVELRPVSEEFADPPPPQPESNDLPAASRSQETDEPVVPLENPPKNLMEWAVLILNTPNPTLKVERTRHAVQAWRTGKITSIGNKSVGTPKPPDVPMREAQYMRNTVDPGKVMRRKNRAVMLHALANIEQWAIDLAWDIMARFGPMHRDLPPAFFSDFTKMALDESKHFTLLRARLSAISPSTPYGSMPVHASLWDSASLTSQSFRARLAIIHLVHEARGLDVNPATIERFRKAGDTETVKVMEIIHADEVTHVTAGHRWFVWICEQEMMKEKGLKKESEGVRVDGEDIVKAFREEVKKYWLGEIKGPFNKEDREKAGLSPEFYEGLRGEMDIMVEKKDNTVNGKRSENGVETIEENLAKMKIEYENQSG